MVLVFNLVVPVDIYNIDAGLVVWQSVDPDQMLQDDCCWGLMQNAESDQSLHSSNTSSNFLHTSTGSHLARLNTSLVIWAQLFKANDVVSLRFVKIYIEWYANMLKFFAEKNVSSFCSAKATHIFSAKNFWKLYIESSKIVNEMALNELVKLTMLWTTGPWLLMDLL